MRFLGISTAALLLFGSLATGETEEGPSGFGFESSMRLELGGQTWLETMTTPFHPEREEETTKVFTHVYDFAGEAPITKGPGGRFSHHRGMFIGWRHTHVGDEDYDTWHMRGTNVQQHRAWERLSGGGEEAVQVQHIDWAPRDGEPFIQERRTIRIAPDDAGRRVIDFTSELTALHSDIQLRGDSHHAGMQIRMSNEVTEHEDTTEYILPEGAEFIENEEVTGANWLCGSFLVGGKRYWVIHMTAPDIVGEGFLYSTRLYGRFGAFWEPDLPEGQPQEFRFRLVISESPLDRETCQQLYDAWQ